MNSPADLPPLSLLDTAPAAPVPGTDLIAGSERLLNALSGLGIHAVVVGMHHGPRVDSFDLQPAETFGQRDLDRVAGPLAETTDAESVIGCVGPGGLLRIQISHGASGASPLRGLLESNVFQGSTSVLSVTPGLTADGDVCVADLAALPHLLIGGSTPNAQRTLINALLTTLLLRCTPADVRLVIVDSTGDASQRFVAIPHLLAPIFTERFHAANALQWAVQEMERRYRWLAAAGARSIRGFNAGEVTAAGGLAPFKRGKRLHHVVLVFTDLADLSGPGKGEADNSIRELSCMSRAAGIHLILATTDHSIEVISGRINVWLPTRIAFRTTSPSDSRTLLFRSGAERLLPVGDAFFLPPSSNTPLRVHTPTVSDAEVDRVTSHWRNVEAVARR